MADHLDDNATASTSSSSQFETLPPRSEYRFELEAGERLSIRLVPESGDAEIFGASLLAGDNRWYTFGEEAKGCVCSWNGCQIELAPPPSAAYLSLEPSPTFSSYANLHLHLEKARLRARQQLRDDAHLIGDLRATSDAQVDEGAEQDVDLYRPEGQGPRILLLGPQSSGKSSLARLLCNYALKSPATTATGQEENGDQGANGASQPTGWWPILVNLDPGTGSLPLPCNISASPLSPLPQAALGSSTPALPFGLTTPVSGALPPTAHSVSSSSPISLWLGREHYRDDSATSTGGDEHGRAILTKLASRLEARMCRDPRARTSGFVVDTAGTSSADAKTKYALIKDIVRLFHIDLVLVLGQEKVTIDLTRIFANQAEGFTNPRVTVLKLPKSGGVAEIDEEAKARLRANQVRTYFYGGSGTNGATKKKAGKDAGVDEGEAASKSKAADGDRGTDSLAGLPALNPYSQTIPLDLLEVYRVGQESMAPSSALPIGASRALSASTLTQLDPLNSAADQASLLNAVLALVDPPGTQGGGGKGQKDSEVWMGELGEEEGKRRLGTQTVRGFVHVQSIDVAKKRMTVLSPTQGRLPTKTALLGTLDWQDA
ncbi:hypothetical protein BDZ90DRAFT_234917 [Jaminaea rosea]|uniref:Polynucleotide 5'-hydroxyl-kinase GRC3 n=1 Tax=Jaminaea rosea TaxID=1569628 RepID=A0A316UH46_9BASI|nr:hypothetical protein BDZ90DRAFT_234917 [Jaminaea rosea]PWN24647.1 hypothetical protein BDZ90DRAFT_234917 [Jaminaea rosea]